MKYGYFNQFVTGIGEDVEAEVALIGKFADKVVVDTLGDRPGFEEMIKKAKKGDTIYVYSLIRSFSGLTDIANEVRILFERGVDVISIKDEFKADHSETGMIAYKTMILASELINVDPNHGFYR